jgi:FdhD protein
MSSRLPVLGYAGAESAARDDDVAREEPLEIQVGGVAVAVVMRTPGHDQELAVGFLVTERVVASAADVVSARHCTTVSRPEAEENVMRVVLRDGVDVPFERLRRSTYASSSCGVCGKATIEAAMATGAPLGGTLRVAASVLYQLPAKLRAGQGTFDVTGGLHAAALFDERGELSIVREDVGRHNAVDKVIGARLMAGAGFDRAVLLVSGRVSFEIVQKAVAAGVALVAGISAPTSLAVEAARALGVTVVGFLRGETMNVYAGEERVSG